MKLKKLLLGLFTIFALYSCKSGKVGSSTNTNDTGTRVSDEGEATKTKTIGETVETVSGSTGGASNTHQKTKMANNNASQVTSGVNVVAQTGGSTGGASNVNMGTSGNSTDWQQLYADLEMSAEQISRLEKTLSDFQKIRVRRPNGEMMGTVDDERTRQLKDILSERQYQKYLKWHEGN